MSKQTTVLATLADSFASRFGIKDNPDELIDVLEATAFKGQVSNEQMIALMLVAQQYSLNPWTKEIYAFPDKQNGIVPVVGVDGWSRIMNEHPQFDGMEFRQDEESCTCIIYRKDRTHPTSATEFMSECCRASFKNSNGYEVKGPWQTHPKRMLRHKAMIQAARLAFGFGGIYDPDEAERIVEAIEVKPVKEEVKRIELPLYPDEKMEKNRDTWRDKIRDGETTPQKIISMISTKYRVSDEQIKAIEDLAVVNDPFVDEMAEFEEVVDENA